MFDDILVPLDGSEAAEAALGHAVAVTRATGATLHVLRVIRPGRAGGLEHDAVEWRLDRTEAKTYVDECADRLRPLGVDAVCEVSEGRPEEEIIACARRHSAGLIVLTTQGRTGAPEFEIGSTAYKVVQAAGTSVLLVRPGEDGGHRPAEDGYRRVLVPVDGSSRGEWAVCLAAGLLSGSSGGRLILVHVVPVPEMVSRIPADEELDSLRGQIVEASHRAAERYFDQLRSRIERPDLSVESRILVSPQVTGTLQQAAEASEADLVVMSAHGASGSAPWPYGSVASHLIRYGRRPLLVLQDEPAGDRPSGQPQALGEQSRPR
ncbi:MAG: universal stress protein [Candidatus Palauibacterales bacterium]|nr:universal stress protein [Candidatus Palauibacterales bacterium]